MKKIDIRKYTLIAACVFFTGASLFAAGNRQATSTGSRQTLEIGIQANSAGWDYNNNPMTSYLQNLHNVDFTFYPLPSSAGDARTRIALMVAADSLPETIWGGGLTWEQILDFGSNGFFRPLNRYFENPAMTPHFNNIPVEYRPSMLKDHMSADGNIYVFPRYQPQTWNMNPYKIYINRQWLNKLGLEVPKTTGELKEVLRAFRDRDPNGNGLQDEIGVFGYPDGSHHIVVALINSFIYWHPSQLALDAAGNTVIAPFVQPAFRTALQYLNDLFKERLIDASSFTNDQQTWRAVLNAETHVVGLTSMHSSSNFPNTATNPAYLAMSPMIAPFSSPISPGYAIVNNEIFHSPQSSFITNKAKNVDLAVKIMDYFYEPDMSIITRYGQENVNWTRDPAILARSTNAYIHLGIYPSVVMMTLVDPNNPLNTNINWHNNTPRFTPLEFTDRVGVNNFDPSLNNHMQDAVSYQLYYSRVPQHIIPSRLNYSINDALTLAPVITTIIERVEQAVAEFTTGVRDINNDASWNSYISELNRMGLQDWIRISQTTYNRMR